MSILGIWQHLGSLAVGVALAGCGMSHSAFDSGQDDERTVSSLTDGEAIELCVGQFRHYEAVYGEGAIAEELCLTSSLGTTDTEDQCSTRVDACVASTLLDEEFFRARCGEDITTVREACTATMADIEACVAETTELHGSVLARTCAEAPAFDAESAAALTRSSPACLALSAACSQFVLHSSR